MAEIGLIASILGVAGAGLKMALTLREVAIQISDAGRQIHDLATNVSLFSMTLKQIGNYIKDGSSPYSDCAVETLEETVDECRAIFFEIETMINETRKSGRGKNHGQPVSLMGRVSWVFEQSRVKYLSTRLESSKLTLSIMLQVFALRVAIDKSDDTREEVEATRQEVEHLRDEIRSLVLDRVWAQRKENSHDGGSLVDDLSLFSYQDRHYAEQRTAQGPSTLSGADKFSSENSHTKVISSSTSLAAFDATIRDMNVKGLSISQDTIIRSVDAAKWLLDQWTIGENQRVHQNQTGDSVTKPNRATHSSSLDDVSRFSSSDDLGESSENSSAKKSRRNNIPAHGKRDPKNPKVPGHSDDADMSDHSDLIEQENIKTNISNTRTSGTLGGDRATLSGTCLEVIPLRSLPKGPYYSTPDPSFKRDNPQIQWRIDRERFIQVCEGDEPRFVWSVAYEGTYMRFLGRYFIGQDRLPKPHYETVLYSEWFSKQALDAGGYKNFTSWRRTGPFLHGQAPFKNLFTRGDATYNIPKVLNYEQVYKLWQKSGKERGNKKDVSTSQYLEYLRLFRILKILEDQEH